MIDTIYIEEEVKEELRTQRLCEKFPHATKISCQRFSEIFNRRCQSFVLQKQKPSLIVAKKYGNCLLPLPEAHALSSRKSFYFSTVYNCPFACSYCFLQGFFQSAHFLSFVNFEEYFDQIQKKIKEHAMDRLYFCAAYETDPLATEFFSSFLEEFLPFFEGCKNSFFELRTKCANITPLLKRKSIENCLVAFSLNPSLLIQTLEKKSSSLEQRIEAISHLQEEGWPIGLRFDPLFFFEGFEEEYGTLFSSLFAAIDRKKIHSATLGTLRFPKDVYKNIKEQNYSQILSPLWENEEGIFGYPKEIKRRLYEFCEEKLGCYLPKEKIFRQENL